MQRVFLYWYSGLVVAAVAACSVCARIVFTQSPTSSVSRFLVYGSLFVLVYAVCCLVELPLRKRFVVAPVRSLLLVANRQSVLIAVLVVTLLYTQAAGLLSWWVGGSITLLCVCIEVWCNT